MLRYALRRVLWAIPTLLATSLILFFVTTLAPDPVSLSQSVQAGSSNDTGDGTEEEARRSRFLDLPRFLNTAPQDVRSRARDAVAHVAAGDARHVAAARQLEALGGAALPHVLPLLESLPPEERRRLAVALVPVGARMGLPGAAELKEPEAAVLFWTRFWDDRALDFTPMAVSRAVSRLVEHGSQLREGDLVSLDTFVLPEVMHAMATSDDRVVLERLTRIARHAVQRGPVLALNGTAADERRVVADWQEWWFVHASDFVVIDGAARAIAVVTETRYGKWLKRAASGELGVSAMDGEPVADKLRARAPVTLLVCALAVLSSWALAVPIGALGAWRQGRAFDVASSAVMFLLYATPTFAVAEVLRRAAGGPFAEGPRLVLAVSALAVGSLATLSRWQRAAMLDVVGRDFVRTAKAKGLPAWRVAVVHALRNALMPIVTLAGFHLPAVLGGAFVVEEVFGLPGVGFETLRAIEARDNAWLMAIVLVSAAAVTAGLVASDVAYGALDPRVREVLTRRQGGRDR
jgi:ABC-type dipeptide/oligopeptide/nickel transport system permease component